MVQIQLKQKGKNRKLRIAKVRTKWESNILVADLFLTSGYVSAWKHVAGIKLCARTAEALEDLLIQIAQAYIPSSTGYAEFINQITALIKKWNVVDQGNEILKDFHGYR